MKILNKILVLMVFAVSITVFPQQIYTSTISATDSLGSVIRIGANEFPTLVITSDSLTGTADSLSVSSKTLKFYVFNGDSAGVWDDSTAAMLEAAGWGILSKEDDGSTDYTVTLVKNRTTPLDFRRVAHLIGRARISGKNQLYIIPYIVFAVGTDATLTFVGQRY